MRNYPRLLPNYPRRWFELPSPSHFLQSELPSPEITFSHANFSMHTLPTHLILSQLLPTTQNYRFTWWFRHINVYILNKHRDTYRVEVPSASILARVIRITLAVYFPVLKHQPFLKQEFYLMFSLRRTH